MKPKTKGADPSVLAQRGPEAECYQELRLSREEREFELFRNAEDDVAFERYLTQEEQP